MFSNENSNYWGEWKKNGFSPHSFFFLHQSFYGSYIRLNVVIHKEDFYFFILTFYSEAQNELYLYS